MNVDEVVDEQHAGWSKCKIWHSGVLNWQTSKPQDGYKYTLSAVQRVEALDKKLELLTGDLHEKVVELNSHQLRVTELEDKLQLAMN